MLEVGEKLEDGVRREVLEETGLEVQPRGVVEIFERIMRDAGGAAEYHYVLVDYLCRVTGGTLCAGRRCQRASNGSRAATWPRYRITEGTLAGDRERLSRTRMKTTTSADLLEFEALSALLGRFVSSPLGAARARRKSSRMPTAPR